MELGEWIIDVANVSTIYEGTGGGARSDSCTDLQSERLKEEVETNQSTNKQTP